MYVGRHAHCLFEGAREVEITHTDFFRHQAQFYSPFLFAAQVFVDQVYGFTQSVRRRFYFAFAELNYELRP